MVPIDFRVEFEVKFFREVLQIVPYCLAVLEAKMEQLVQYLDYFLDIHQIG